ncbi:MAG: hypothetical protein ACC658_16775, partial [Acidimicrobiia bacterium]
LFIIHIVGVALAVGTGFAILALKMGSADMDKAEREPYMLRGFVVTNVGAIGIVFVLVSGLVMFFQDSEALILTFRTSHLEYPRIYQPTRGGADYRP